MSTFETGLVIKIPEIKYSWLDRIAIRILQDCDFPKHIAYILDGNRRFSRSKKIPLVDGYGRAGQNMLQIFDICCKIGVQFFTLYLFSIENFNRSKEEVDDLMEMMHQQLLEISKRIDEVHKRQICVRVYGKIELFPVHSQKLIAQLVLQTANNSKIYVNICAPYTAREEIAKAIEDLQSCVKDELLSSERIDHFIFSSALYSCEFPEPDLLVRTSGVNRLSDFLLWQSAFSYILFVEEQWPEFNKYSLFKALLQYSIKYETIASKRTAYEKNVLKSEFAEFVKFPKNSGCSFEKFCVFKKQQTDFFRNYFHQKMINYFVNIAKQS